MRMDDYWKVARPEMVWFLYLFTVIPSCLINRVLGDVKEKISTPVVIGFRYYTNWSTKHDYNRKISCIVFSSKLFIIWAIAEVCTVLQTKNTAWEKQSIMNILWILWRSGFLPQRDRGRPPLWDFCPPEIWSENNRNISITKEICITIDSP